MLLQLFGTYLKIGTFTLGGGYAMLPLIQREVVDRRRWLDEKEFLNMIALAQAAPGLIAVNSAIFIGWRIGREYALRCHTGHVRLYTTAAVAVTILGAVLPSIVIILLIAVYLHDLRHYAPVEAALKGIRPAVVALIAATVIRLAKKI